MQPRRSTANEQFRALLEDGNVQALRSAWAQVAPHLPQPATRQQAEIVMHHARTQSEVITFPKRAWSHRWLAERNLPSGLPDALRPKAEQLCPRVVEGVGISVKSKYPEVERCVRTAMEHAVLDAYAEKRTDPVFVRQRMALARRNETRRLFGSLTGGR
jgi:hypothetical protein